MTHALELIDVSKSYRKDVFAVNDLSFHVTKGSFTALLGPNGSGKSTTLKMCSNLLEPTSGSILINGTDIADDPVEALSAMGCVIDTPAMYGDCTPRESIQLLCRLRGMRKEAASAETDRVLEVVDMSPSADERFSKFSKGMKQRIILAQALIGDPEILILDEPSSGLDPKGMREMESILLGLHRGGMSVLMSSHMLQEVERTCERFVFINRGKEVLQQTIDEYRAGIGTVVRFARPLSPGEISILRSMPGVREIDGEGRSVIMDVGPDDSSRASVIRRLVGDGLPVCGIGDENRLERMFMEADSSDGN